MDLTVESTTVTGLEDRSWLGSAHGVESCDSVTLNMSLFTEATHFPTGELRGGTALAKVTATGLYGPYDNTATDGRQVGRGYLFNTVHVRAAGAQIGAPMLRHGKVRVANLPANNGHDTAFEADVPNIIHV